MKVYKTKTFNIDKFTVVGEPTITEDGIASGFSGDDYVTLSAPQLGTCNSWTIISPSFTIGNTLSRGQMVYKLTYGLYWGGTRVWLEKSKLIIDVASDASHDKDILRFDTLTVLPNTKYQVKTTFTGEEYIVWYRVNDGEWTEYDRISSTTKVYNNLQNFYIGNSHSTYTYFEGSIDLKQLSIIADGEEILNGTKDILKLYGDKQYEPSKFTVVGEPTITEDGIASGFSWQPTCVIKGNIPSITATNNITVTHEYLYDTNSYGSSNFGGTYCFGNDSTRLFCGYYAQLWTSTATLVLNTGSLVSPLNLKDGDKIKCTVSLTEDSATITVSANGLSVTNSASSSISLTKTNFVIGAGAINGFSPCLGQIDLKTFSITVDDEEVFNGTKDVYKVYNL